MKPSALLTFAWLALAGLGTTPAATPTEAAKPSTQKAKGMPEGVADLAIGAAAPDFSLPGIDDKKHTLADYRDAKVLMVAFISNHCPDSQAAEGRIKKLVAELKGQSFALVAINPNNPASLRLDELGYSKYNDSFDEMKLHAKEQGFDFSYLYDGETQAAAKAYGCLATPHIFIFDAERKLRYKGAFDDSRFGDPATVKSEDARNATLALLAGKLVDVETSKVHGCSTKWLTKKAAAAEDDQKWAKMPVDLETIDAAGVAALRKNGTKKVRLFNVWATWCISCVEEFPEITKTAHKFGLRDFELVTISLDQPEEKAKVKEFLESQGAAIPAKIKSTLKAEGRTTNSYIFTGGSHEELVKALDPQWEGPTPFTVLVAPNGDVIWRHTGEVDGEEMRGKILEYMGRYYKPD
ncbi:MAG TPA: redoxin domain-containing protein [Verrucomicrobium sp.]|nr:redoxin domain-containing protein [Verrucomicrobium sp.]